MGVLDDLEQEAEGLALAGRDAEVADLARGEYAAVDLSGRLHASVGAPVVLDVPGPGALEGRLVRAGDGWCLLAGAGEWLVPTAAVAAARGLSPRALPEEARGLGARLGVGSVLRRVAEERTPVLVVRRDGQRVAGAVLRVGADFVEVAPDDGGAVVVALAHVAAVRLG